MPDAPVKLHCNLGASNSHRWWKCPGSARAVLTIAQPQTVSHYAGEGTAAHELAAHCLRHGCDASSLIGQDFEGFTVTVEMCAAVQEYLNYVRALDQQYGALPADCVWTEREIKLLGKDTDGLDRFGTIDRGYHVPYSTLHVIDYKHGQGMIVDVQDNTQLLDYLLGMWLSLDGEAADEIISFKATICQPRAGGITECEYTRDEMIAFMDTQQEKLDAAHDPNAPLIPGDHCRNTFCPFRSVCPALENHVHEVAALRFSQVLVSKPSLPDVSVWTPERKAMFMENVGILKGWIKDAEEKLLTEATANPDAVPGWQPVSGQGNRQWLDESAINIELGKWLMRNRDDSRVTSGEISAVSFFTAPELLSVAQMEKMIKRNRLDIDLSPHIHRPATAPKLVKVNGSSMQNLIEANKITLDI